MPHDRVRYELDPKSLRKVLPDGPGVYLFVDLQGKVIYVGKAKNLKKRVLSYFRSQDNTAVKTTRMMQMADGLEFILTLTEKDAFILENDLIKKFKPRYNIILRDDKQYPCLRLDVHEPYPRLGIVRKIKKDGALYFGPFSSANAVRNTTRVIAGAFKLRKCKGAKLKTRTRPCLNFQMDRCLGPCAHKVSEKEYAKMVEQVRLFLEGRNRELVGDLKKEMEEAAGTLDFERAAEIRDRIQAIERTVERQHVVSPHMIDQDVIGIAQMGPLHQVAVLFVRGGHLTGSRSFLFEDQTVPMWEVLEAFLKQYYSAPVFIPNAILISESISDSVALREWLCDLAGKKIMLHHPERGEKKKRVDMAVANAKNQLLGYQVIQKEDLLNSAQSLLNLKKIPRTIEGLDISNFQGGLAVGTVVSFKDGEPDPSNYLNYRIKQVDGIDDYGMMAEMVGRRIAGKPLPDLFLVDGGKGHLAAVKRVLDRQAESAVDAPVGVLPEVISLAKPNEGLGEQCDKIYIPGRKNPVGLKANHPVLFLMMRIRDEAHRRAITYHRNLRAKSLTRSCLDGIPGIGKKRKQIILKYFKSLDVISKATVEELSQAPGISRDLALKIFQGLSNGYAKEKGCQPQVDEKAQDIV